MATLVLLDLRMPRMGGIEACMGIRELPRYATVPICIFLLMPEYKARSIVFLHSTQKTWDSSAGRLLLWM